MSKPPPGFAHGVIVPPRIAYLLNRDTNLDGYRRQRRGDDPELDEILNTLRWAAMSYADSVNGSQRRKPAEAQVDWYKPAQAAIQTGLTEHAIRLAIREGRLPATKIDGRWQISPVDYQNFIRTHRR